MKQADRIAALENEVAQLRSVLSDGLARFFLAESMVGGLLSAWVAQARMSGDSRPVLELLGSVAIDNERLAAGLPSEVAARMRQHREAAFASIRSFLPEDGPEAAASRH